MARTEIFLPAMGEGIIEATITKWLVKEGEQVEEDDPIVEVATDKVDTEIPSPGSGTVKAISFNEGDTPKVGDILAWLESEGNETVEEELKEEVDNEYRLVKAEAVVNIVETSQSEKSSSELKSRTPDGKYLSPLVRKMANKEGISYDELDRISGTGMDGRITRSDLLAYYRG